MSNLHRFQNTADCEQCIIQDYGGEILYAEYSTYLCVCVYARSRALRASVIVRETTKRPTAF